MAGGVGSAHASSFGFDDLVFWVGSGSNEAGFVIDWGDGRDPLAWGYRWDGAATGEDMLLAIVSADDRLFTKVSPPGGFGVALLGLGYDRDGDGFGIDDDTMFGDGGIFEVPPPQDGAMASDMDDSYAEGWSTAFWSYWVSDGSPYGGGGEWDFAPTGISGRSLTDGAWDGFSFAPDFISSAPNLPVAAVPSGGGVALAVVGSVMAGRRRRR